jgi:hypothetical protein
MIILFGWRTKVKQVGPLVLIKCPQCHNDTMYQYFRTQRWFTLFFVPVLPIGVPKHFMICPICSRRLVFKRVSQERPLIDQMLSTTAAWQRHEMAPEAYDQAAAGFLQSLREIPPAGAGWHPDPHGDHEYRYFDGERWTDQVSNDGTTATDPFDRPVTATPRPPIASTPPTTSGDASLPPAGEAPAAGSAPEEGAPGQPPPR